MAVPTWSVGQVLAASDVNSWFVPLVGYKTGTTSRSSATATIDPDLQVTLAANAAYRVVAGLNYSGAPVIGWTFPSGGTGAYTISYNEGGVGSSTYAFAWGATPGNPGATTNGIMVAGLIVTSSTSGTLGFNWGSSSGSTTFGIGNMLEVRRVG